jgi:hypothetical protein
MSEDATIDAGPAAPAHPHIRLVYSRPADLPPLPPRRPLNLAIAIERHLQGGDGFTDEQFAVVFARRVTSVEAGRAPSAL